MPRQRQQRAVIDDVALIVLAGHCRRKRRGGDGGGNDLMFAADADLDGYAASAAAVGMFGEVQFHGSRVCCS